MTTLDYLNKHIPEIELLLGYTFNDKELLSLAFIHRSFINENRQIAHHNERLEFLGDSVLGLLIANYLYVTMPATPEGELSYLRSRLVEASSCMAYVHDLRVSRFLLLGKGERMNDGRGRESILADLFEAIIGAIFLDGGLEASRTFLFEKLKSNLETILKMPIQNWKAILQDFCQKKYGQPPDYKLVSELGPDHSKHFEIAVEMNGQLAGCGRGASKKEAQQAAAKDALNNLPAQEG
jgi:ribonuclease III